MQFCLMNDLNIPSAYLQKSLPKIGMAVYHKEVLKQTIILGIYFMLTYTTFLSFSCIITYIAEHEQGQYSYGPLVALSANYFTYLITLIFCTRIKDFKFQFQVSALCHLVNYVVYIPDYKGDLGLLMGIIGALFGGYGAAIYWVSQGGYLIKLFKKYNIPKDEEGKYFGIANGIVYGSSLFGALVTTFGLGYFGSTVYFIILSVLTVISLLVCTFFLDGLKDVDKVDSLLSEQETPLKATKSDSLFKVTKDTFIKTMKYYPKMYYLVIPVILDGIISGFISVYLNKLIAEESRTNLNVGYMLMTEGLGCIIGAVASATISDKISVIKVGKVGMILIIITSALTFTDTLIEPATLYLPMAVSFLWGITINYITSWESVSCAKLNEGQLQSFSIVKQIQAISYIFFTLSMILTDNTIDVPYFLCALTVFCFSSMVILAVYERFNSELSGIEGDFSEQVK